MIVAIGGSIENAKNVSKIKQIPQSDAITHSQLQEVTNLYFYWYAKIPDSEVITQSEYLFRIHCKLCVNERGLGP